jgi:diacylglycerol kinase family enzyme
VIAYGFAALVPLLRRKPFELHVKWPGSSLKLTTQQAIVTSGRYFGWQPLTPQADIRSGELWFFAAAGRNPVDAVVINAALLQGKQTNLQDAHFFSASKMTIAAKPKQPLNIDGHAFGTTPAHFRIARNALRVLVPQSFE